jgi:hypothetical protein
MNITAFLDYYKQVGLEGSTDKMKYMLSHQNHSIKIANKNYENVTQLKHF